MYYGTVWQVVSLGFEIGYKDLVVIASVVSRLPRFSIVCIEDADLSANTTYQVKCNANWKREPLRENLCLLKHVGCNSNDQVIPRRQINVTHFCFVMRFFKFQCLHTTVICFHPVSVSSHSLTSCGIYIFLSNQHLPGGC